ncbi:MAG: hypothetical protein KGO05_10085 [Chloroflexota bacterium]|nr:hypothetical protein [Chloroflexota bacterium]
MEGQATGTADTSSLIHLTWRRGDADDSAGRIYDRLVARYGPGVVARDLFGAADEAPTEPAARTFLAGVMERVVAQVVVIGPRWREGLARPNDLQHVEIAAALARQTPIIPVLAAGATMPASAQLPADIATFALFNAALARLDPDFDADMGRLLATLERYAPSLAIRPAPPPPAPTQGVAASAPAANGCRRWAVRLGVGGALTAALLYLLIAILVTLSGAGNALPASATAATPAATATDFPTPFATGEYFSPLTNGAPDWLTINSGCQAKPDGYHIVDSAAECPAPNAAQSANGQLTVTARQISGATSASYGLCFRDDGIQGSYYVFAIRSDGKWSLGAQLFQTFTYVLPWRASSAIHTGLGATNTLTARFNGSDLAFSVNGRPVGAVHNGAIPPTGPPGDGGLSAHTGLIGSRGANVVFTNYRLARLA